MKTGIWEGKALSQGVLMLLNDGTQNPIKALNCKEMCCSFNRNQNALPSEYVMWLLSVRSGSKSNPDEVGQARSVGPISSPNIRLQSGLKNSHKDYPLRMSSLDNQACPCWEICTSQCLPTSASNRQEKRVQDSKPKCHAFEISTFKTVSGNWDGSPDKVWSGLGPLPDHLRTSG